LVITVVIERQIKLEKIPVYNQAADNHQPPAGTPFTPRTPSITLRVNQAGIVFGGSLDK